MFFAGTVSSAGELDVCCVSNVVVYLFLSLSQAPHCPPPSTCTSLTGTTRGSTQTSPPTPHHSGTNDITVESTSINRLPEVCHQRIECDRHNGDQQCVLDANCHGTRDGSDCSRCRVHGHSERNGTTYPTHGMSVIVMLFCLHSDVYRCVSHA